MCEACMCVHVVCWVHWYPFWPAHSAGAKGSQLFLCPGPHWHLNLITASQSNLFKRYKCVHYWCGEGQEEGWNGRREDPLIRNGIPALLNTCGGCCCLCKMTVSLDVCLLCQFYANTLMWVPMDRRERGHRVWARDLIHCTWSADMYTSSMRGIKWAASVLMVFMTLG